ncbi:MAG: phosphatase PAP2 family protein [Clostridia bacterium]|nr:phosphatase PAP2 family protein [Clostridia bacterium]
MERLKADYKNFTFKKMFTKEFSHVWYLFVIATHFLSYILTEKLIIPDNCYVVHSRLDDIIPFCEYFIVPYILWYVLLFFTGIYFMFYDVNSFKKFMNFLIISQVIATIIFIVFPTRQDLRPDEFLRDNIFVDMVKNIYVADTNTNVCPSMHVVYSIAIISIWLKQKNANIYWRWFVVVFSIIICLSTVFLKQHSVIDIYVAVALCVLVEIMVYRKYWIKKFKKIK